MSVYIGSEERRYNRQAIHSVTLGIEPKSEVMFPRDPMLAGRRLLILGTGETGMDLAYEAAKAGAKEVVLCTRAG